MIEAEAIAQTRCWAIALPAISRSSASLSVLMEIDHVHFYVDNATSQRDWFVRQLGFKAVARSTDGHTHTEVVNSGSVYFLLSSPLSATSPVAEFLHRHPCGVADIALCVANLTGVLDRAIAVGAKVLQPIQEKSLPQGRLKWAKIAGWGELTHTLIERIDDSPCGDRLGCINEIYAISNHKSQEILASDSGDELNTQASDLVIDHVVLNVNSGDLSRATSWYEKTLGFQPQQTFVIHTERSGLYSQVMVHPHGGVQLPINEPTSDNSQIQEFLDVNGGPGIQHIALRTGNIVQVVARLRQKGLSFIEVPPTYYTNLRQRFGFQKRSAEWQEIETQQILVDGYEEGSNTLLLQTFTQPIFAQPTVFFELIERRCGAEGFGEGNFRALFEAIEKEQIKREEVEGDGEKG